MYNDAFTSFPVIETERLNLRRLEDTDVDDIYEYAQNKDAFIYTDGFPHEYGEVKQALNAWRNEAYQSREFIRWAIEHKEEKKVIGGIYLFLPHGNDEAGRRMEIRYEISHKYYKQGYATESIKAICEYGFTHMGLVRIQAQVIPENIGSIRACEKAGLTNEGTLRNYCHYMYEGYNKLTTMVMMACIPEDFIAEAV